MRAFLFLHPTLEILQLGNYSLSLEKITLPTR